MSDRRRVYVKFCYDTDAETVDARPDYGSSVAESLLDAIDHSGFDSARIREVEVRVSTPRETEVALSQTPRS